MRSLFLPNSLTTLSVHSFEESSLVTIIFGKSIKVIPKHCFFKCSNLRKIYFGDSVEEIGQEAFYDSCRNLDELQLPVGLRTIGMLAFGFSGITSIKMPELTIPEGIESLGAGEFYNWEPEKVTLPATIKKIKSNAFVVGADTKIQYTGTEEQFKKIVIYDMGDFTPDAPIILVTPQKQPKYKVTSIVLDKDTFYYDGKVHTPIASVLSVKTIALKGYTSSSEQIQLINDIGNYKPGTYKVTAKGIGDSTGSAEATYSIIVKPVKIKSVKPAKTSMAITVKGLAAKYVSGYEAQYSTKANMKGAKKITIGKSYKKVSNKITKLTANKKYYVQVRSYVTIGRKKYYSEWSKTKEVKTKK